MRASMLRFCFTPNNNTDYATADEAIEVVEAIGSGSVVKSRLDYNLPGCLPILVHRSCAMWSFKHGKWHAYGIFDGRGNVLIEEKPQ